MKRPFPTFVVTLLQLVLLWRNWVRLTRWSSRPMLVRAIMASPWAVIWWGRWAPPITLPTPQLLAQMINFPLQLQCLMVMWNMAPGLGMTLLSTFSVIRSHHNTWGMLPVSHTFQVNKLVLPLGANWLLPILAYISHKYSGWILHNLLFPQTVPIVRTRKICSPSPLRVVGCAFQPWPKSIEFVRKWNKQQRALPEDSN